MALGYLAEACGRGDQDACSRLDFLVYVASITPRFEELVAQHTNVGIHVIPTPEPARGVVDILWAASQKDLLQILGLTRPIDAGVRFAATSALLKATEEFAQYLQQELSLLDKESQTSAI